MVSTGDRHLRGGGSHSLGGFTSKFYLCINDKDIAVLVYQHIAGQKIPNLVLAKILQISPAAPRPVVLLRTDLHQLRHC